MTNETEISLEEIKTILSNYKGLKKQIRNHISDLYDDLMDTDNLIETVSIKKTEISEMGTKGGSKKDLSDIIIRHTKGKVNDMNECTYLGRICTDLVLNKKAMDDKENYWTRFRLAVARKRVKKEGEKDTDFFNCVAFGSAAKGICTYAKKGGRICVCGENRENNFEKDGMKYYTVELFIKDYHVIDFKEKKQASGDVTEEAPFPPE